MTPTTICYFTDSLEPSGVGTHLALLLEGLDRRRWRPLLVCPPTEAAAGLLRRAGAAGVPHYPLTVRDGDQADYAALVALLRDEGVALFHNQIGAGWEGHWGTRAAREAGVPVVVSTEHLPYILTRADETALKREINLLVNRLITVSQEAGRSHLRSGTVRRGQAVVIPNGINPAPFAAVSPHEIATTRATLDLPPTAPIVLTVARLYEQKGHRYLLDAWPQVRATPPGAILLIVGDGPLRPKLEAQAAALNLGDSVRFLGTRPDVPTLLALADLAVLPSLFEGLPLFVLEAMAAARPTVATRVCGASEAVADGETGLLVPARDPPALAAAIIRLLADPARRAQMGRAARRRLYRRFHSQRMTAATTALYRRLLARHHR